MKYEIFAPLAIQDIGQRPNQEDSLYPSFGRANKNDRLFILCDGMGGHMNGEVASSVVCGELSNFVKEQTAATEVFTDMMMTKAMEAVYNKLNAFDKAEGTNERKMGTTMIMLYFHAGGLMAAHIGDSRYYHIRPKNHEIIYQSKDHSYANVLYDAGEITLSEAKSLKNTNVMRAIMPHQEQPVMPDIVHIKDIRPGDWFYMCSDGMLENMDDEELLNILCNESMTDEQKRDCLIAATDDNKDNHSAYLIHISSVIHEIIDENEPDDELLTKQSNVSPQKTNSEIPEVIVEAYPQPQPTLQQTAQISHSKKNHTTLPETNSTKNNNMLLRTVITIVIVAIVITCVNFFFNNHNKKEVKPKQSPKETIYIETAGKTVSRNPVKANPVISETSNKKEKNKSKGVSTKVSSTKPVDSTNSTKGSIPDEIKQEIKAIPNNSTTDNNEIPSISNDDLININKKKAEQHDDKKEEGKTDGE